MRNVALKMHLLMPVALAAALPLRAHAQTAAMPGAPVAGWPSAGNGASNTRNAPGEHALAPANVGKLTPMWTLKTTGDVPDTPTLDGNDLFAVDNGGSVWRVDAHTGKPIWRISLPKLTGNAKSTARTSPAIAPGVIVIGDQAAATVYALNRKDGSLAWRMTLDKAQAAFITSSPVIVNGTVVVGVSSLQEELATQIKNFKPNFRGSVAALDLNTGSIKWQVRTVPDGFSGGGVWGSNLAVDPQRNAVFIGTGDNYSVPKAVAACQAASTTPGQLDACLPKDDHIDSVLSLNLQTGAINWANRLTVLDTWTVSCLPSAQAPKTPCPEPAGLDYDFGSGPNLFSTAGNAPEAVVGAGQKSGIYWAFNRDTGKLVWATQVSPGGVRGGIEWGSAVDGDRVYIAASNANYVWTQLAGKAKLTDGGFWSALDISTGKILWQTPTAELQKKPANNGGGRGLPIPKGALARTEGAVSVANGVMYGADASGLFVALNAKTGVMLWSMDAKGAAIDAPAIVNGHLYWGDGYGDIGPSNSAIYAFGLTP
jgi:polyvinyl alcohol dehydrogenase (cytochrome)